MITNSRLSGAKAAGGSGTGLISNADPRSAAGTAGAALPNAATKKNQISFDLIPNHTFLRCFANGNDVDTVIVDGKVALRDRQPVFVDEGKVLAAAQRECELMLDRAGIRNLTEVPASVWQ